jgi:hypothetical protein
MADAKMASSAEEKAKVINRAKESMAKLLEIFQRPEAATLSKDDEKRIQDFQNDILLLTSYSAPSLTRARARTFYVLPQIALTSTQTSLSFLIFSFSHNFIVLLL